METTTNQSNNIAELIDKHLDEALNRAGSTALSTEQREVLKQQLLMEIEKRLRLVTFEALNEKDLADYGALVEAGNFGMAEQVVFFKSRIPNYENFLQQALTDVTNEFVKLSQS